MTIQEAKKVIEALEKCQHDIEVSFERADEAIRLAMITPECDICNDTGEAIEPQEGMKIKCVCQCDKQDEE